MFSRILPPQGKASRAENLKRLWPNLDGNIIIPPVVTRQSQREVPTIPPPEESEDTDSMGENLLTSQISLTSARPQEDSTIFTQREKATLTIIPSSQVVSADGSISLLPSHELSINYGEFTAAEFNSRYKDGIDTVIIGENATIGLGGANALNAALTDGRITRLSFSGRITDIVALNILINAIKSSKEIQSLSWGGDSVYVNDLIDAIAEALQNNPKLENLCLCNITVSSDDVYELATALKENQTLQGLSFIGVKGIGEIE
ncbi:MAG: hypothetical protein K6C34_02195 [Alphaproteobacteria bacterium]|nr:hypothetical protein [Alphaproteobacteria bacterium]